MGTLFDKAKKNSGKGKATVNREVYNLEDEDLGKDICRLAEINSQVATLKGEAEILHGNVKEAAVDKFAAVYEANEKFPGSMQIESGDGGFMLIPTDRYIGIDKDAADELMEEREELVDEVTTYTMDSALVEKHGEVISDLIENCKEIPEGEKEKLISASVKYQIKKGTISDLKTKFSDTPVRDMLDIIKPVYQIKGIKDLSKVAKEADA